MFEQIFRSEWCLALIYRNAQRPSAPDYSCHFVERPKPMRMFALAALVVVANVGIANAWWSYAEWGMSETQLLSASGGRAAPCRPEVSVCTRPTNGMVPSLFVDGIKMVGMPAAASFAFDGQGRLVQTVVLFPGGDTALLSNLLSGVHGQPVEDRSTTPPRQVWRDEHKGTVITVAPAGSGVSLLYRPTPSR